MSRLDQKIIQRSPWVAMIIGMLALGIPSLPNSSSVQQAQLRSPRVESEPNYRTVAGWTIAALGAGVVGLGWHNSRSNQLRFASTGSLKPSSVRLDRANRTLQRRLLSLLHDDRQAADRLVAGVQLNHPNRSIDWCVEKVIYDLNRDRH